MKRCWQSPPIWLFAFLFSCNSPQKADRPIDFEKIVFHTTMCFGKCPTYHLSVDKEKNLMLYAEEVYRNPRDFNTHEIDYSKVGYFRGKVDDSTFNSLTMQLNQIGLDSLEFDEMDCCDGTVITIIIHYNGKKKRLHSMNPPDKADSLISTLYAICRLEGLQRTDEKFAIEYE